MNRFGLALLLCAFVAWSQHIGSDGFWWRQESAAVPEAECRALLKIATGRPKVGFTKWYDVTTQQLEKQFGRVITPDKGTWLACWAEGTTFGEPDQ